jgi:hypothetical protein
MKKYNTTLSVALTLLIAASSVSGQTIQFGGDVSHITDGTTAEDTAWQSAIGADQIIRWDGVNSDGGGSGASGTLHSQGVGATLTSLGAEDLVLTTRAVSATTGPTTTFAYGNPNYLGVDSGGDTYGAQFESNFSEAWVFDFSKDVTLNSMIGLGLAFNGQKFGIDIGNDGSYEYEWTRTGFTEGSGSVVGSAFGGTNEYLASFTTGIAISAGTDIKITSINGYIGLEGLVVTVPEPATYALLAGALALASVMVRRRR